MSVLLIFPEVVEVVAEVSLGQFLLLSLGSSFETGLVEDIVARERLIISGSDLKEEFQCIRYFRQNA